jgi:hypothetical protein
VTIGVGGWNGVGDSVGAGSSVAIGVGGVAVAAAVGANVRVGIPVGRSVGYSVDGVGGGVGAYVGTSVRILDQPVSWVGGAVGSAVGAADGLVGVGVGAAVNGTMWPCRWGAIVRRGGTDSRGGGCACQGSAPRMIASNEASVLLRREASAPCNTCPTLIGHGLVLHGASSMRVGQVSVLERGSLVT